MTIKSNIKPGKIKKVGSEDWKKAKASIPSQEELAEIIRGKNQEKVVRQQRYRELVLTRMEKEASLYALKALIAYHERKVSKPSENYSLIEYGAYKYPLPVWRATFNLELHKYTVLLSNERYMLQALKKDGLSDKQIDDLLQKQKYVKFK